MAEPTPAQAPKLLSFLLLSLLVPIAAYLLLHQLDSFDAAPYPIHEFAPRPISAPYRNHLMLHGSELVGLGSLNGPEDFAYDPVSNIIYTGCGDGWIKRVTVNDSVSDTTVRSWVNTGGRPLGLALGPNGEVFVADGLMGLMKISEDGNVKLLTDEAEGLKFRLTDGVDVGKDGTVYFTDASYKSMDSKLEFLEGRPYGRFMSYDPITETTRVLARDLYFANGVAVSPNQDFVVFCETFMRRCKKYYIQGEKKGSVEIFIDNLPGLPDNIRYDGEGQYWIGLYTGITLQSELAQRYTFIRKSLAIMKKYIGLPTLEKNSGVLMVDLNGNPIAHYYDSKLTSITGGIKIGSYLYCGSVINPYIVRLNLNQYPALPLQH